LFEFLSVRASGSVINAVLDADPNVLRREARSYWKIWGDHRIRFLARVHRLHRLPEEVRAEAETELTRTAIENMDVSFLDVDDVLGLFQPAHLLSLGIRLVGMVNDVISNRITEIAEGADPDQDVPDQFDQVKAFVDQLRESFADDESIQSTLQSLTEEIEVAVARVSERKTPDEDYGSWPDVSPAKVGAVQKGRSMFSDVDE
jgi:hypothetical protein